jgi:proteasome-associated ATPase
MAWFGKKAEKKADPVDPSEIGVLHEMLRQRDHLIDQLRQDNPTAEQVMKIREALETARGALLEQREMLEKLTSPPFAYATVVCVNNNYVPRFVDFEEPGTRVRIRRDSKYASQNSGPGTVQGVHVKGWVIVNFDSGGRNGYRTGKVVEDDIECDGTCDLELDEQSTKATAVIAIEGKFLEVLLPEDRKIEPGDTVTLVMQTMQIVDVAAAQFGGDIAYLRRVVDETFSEVDYESAVRVVFNGKFGDLEKGDRVVLDSTGSVIIRNLGKEDERFSFTAETNITWDDIGGLAEAKKQMVEAVELPHKNPEIFRFYGKKPVKGILLYGPPGCGKTMLGKATATALASIYNGNGSSAGFIYIKGPEILDRYIGVAEATIRQIFQRARKHKEEHGYPAVVFIDEADAILAKRGSGISSDVERTIVPMFLTEMDGLEDSGALVILATNRSDILDPAVVRDGRIDRKVKIERPTIKSAAEIFKLSLQPVPLHNGYSREELAQLGSSQLFDPSRVLYQVQTRSNGVMNFTLGHIINGGMVVNVIDQATSIALQRDLSKDRPEGLSRDDIVAAVNAVEKQNRDLNHADDLAEFVHDFRDDVVDIQKLRQSSE